MRPWDHNQKSSEKWRQHARPEFTLRAKAPSQKKFFASLSGKLPVQRIVVAIIGVAVLSMVGIFQVALLGERAQAIALQATNSGITDATHAVAGEKIWNTGGDVVIQSAQPEPPKLPVFSGTPFDVEGYTADALLVKDTETKMTLFGHNAYTPRPIASVTKLMSALVVLEKSPVWTSTTTVVSDNLVDTHMYAGDTYTLDELWYAALVGSSNKAIMTLADAVGWPREAFVERMNQRATELGMVDTHFVEPTGLNAGNVSTVSDLSLLLDEVLTQEKIVQALEAESVNLYASERGKRHNIWNTDWLLLGWIPNTFDSVIGKTGYIPEAGYNFVMRTKDEKGHELNVLVLGTASHEARFEEARDAALWAFTNHVWPDEQEESSVTSEELEQDGEGVYET